MHFDARDYPEHNAVEWQVRLQAPSDAESPLYENVMSADFVASFPSADERGAPLEQRQPCRDHRLPAARRGARNPAVRSCWSLLAVARQTASMPYFNLASEGGGTDRRGGMVGRLEGVVQGARQGEGADHRRAETIAVPLAARRSKCGCRRC